MGKKFFLKRWGFVSVKKCIKSGVYLVVVDNIKYILKVKRFKRWFGLELLINKKLLKYDFKYFNFPKLIDTDKKNYLLFEYIEGSRGINKKHINKELLISGLLEFNTFFIFKNKEETRDIYGGFLFSVFISILRGIFLYGFSNIGTVASLKCFVILCKNSICEKPFNYYFLQHRDLGNEDNKISSKDGRVYFIDFAQTRKENKWILMDIIDISMPKKTLKLDHDLFILYLKKLNKEIDKNINIKRQVRMALLRKTLHLMGEKSNKAKHISKNFLLQILLNNNKFNKWFEENMIKQSNN